MQTTGTSIGVIATTLLALALGICQSSVGQDRPAGAPAKAPFTITVVAESSVVKSGEAVFIKAALANNSNRPLDASTCYCGPSGLDTIFAWEVRDSSERLTAKRVYRHPELATGSPILDRVIKPGGEISGDHDISRLYDMKKPGKYVVQASYQVPKALGGGTIRSNAVTVTVTP